MFHKISIIGNLGNDPEMRYMPDGTPVTSFSIASNRRWGGDNPGEETTWFRISAWGRLAENCNQYLSKGRQVFIEGRMVQDKETGGPRVWSGNDGQPRASFEVRALDIKFLSGGTPGEGGGGGFSNNRTSSSPPKQDAIAEDEIPF